MCRDRASLCTTRRAFNQPSQEHDFGGPRRLPLGDDWGRDDWGDSYRDGNDGRTLAIDLGLRTLARNVASLTTAVASLSSSVQRTSVGSCAVAGDVSKFAASVALHSLSLAVTGKVVGSTAFVTGCRASTTNEAAAESTRTGKPSARSRGSTANTRSSRVRTCTLQVMYVSQALVPCAEEADSRQGGRPFRTSSSVHSLHLRSVAGLGSRPGRVRDPGSDSIAWLSTMVSTKVSCGPVEAWTYSRWCAGAGSCSIRDLSCMRFWTRHDHPYW